MYNLGMENIVENKVKRLIDKYLYYIILCIVICILFLSFGYSKQDVQYTVYLENEMVELSYNLLTKNNEQYIHIDDLTSVFKNNIYNDKISGKIIITTENNLKKISKTDEIYVVKTEAGIYFNLKKIMIELGKECYKSNDKIYILKTSCVEGIIKDNRVELYDEASGNIIGFLDKDSKVKVLTEYLVKEFSQDIVKVVTSKNVYGYILKSHVNFEYVTDTKIENLKKQIMVKVDGSIASGTDVSATDIIAVNMYRLSGVNSLAKLDYNIDGLDKTKVYAVINNGQKSSNYDADILTEMLYSESNRNKVIQQILTSVKNIAGVNIDFGSFKVSDKDNFTQFIKELAAKMHANNKKIIVNIPSTQYIDIKQISIVVDYVVLQPYFARTLASKTSGPISSVKYVEEQIQNIANKNTVVEKIILEVPAYSILWTERRGTVINTEQYTMKTAAQYIRANNLKTRLDSTARQNYINYTKGITTYKMWLEDEYSVTEKVKLVNKYNLAGISIYRSGFETEEIYDKISSSLNK